MTKDEEEDDIKKTHYCVQKVLANTFFTNKKNVGIGITLQKHLLKTFVVMYTRETQ